MGKSVWEMCNTFVRLIRGRGPRKTTGTAERNGFGASIDISSAKDGEQTDNELTVTLEGCQPCIAWLAAHCESNQAIQCCFRHTLEGPR